MIYGPKYNPKIDRIQPVDSDSQEEQKEGKKNPQVLFQGRAWSESKKDLPLQPSIPQTPPPSRTRRSSTGVYADKVVLERAQNKFNQLTTIEERAAQLCFLSTAALYDASIQRAVELIIQTWQIGGVLFNKGEYRREAYLIERYQEISKTPLLFANDYLHGLSFYLQGGALTKEILSEQHYSDLGKAVMVQNRRLGVHVQFDREREKRGHGMNEMQIKAFRKGVRGAHGIVGKEKRVAQSEETLVKGTFPFLNSTDGPIPISEYQIQETISFKTLTFFDASRLDKSALESELPQAFKQLCDVFLLSDNNVSEAVRIISKLVRTGKLREEVFDRLVMKVLILKALFFK